MVNKCCVPGCIYNPAIPTTCFKFPSDEEIKKKWIENIPRSDQFNTKYVGICILHFDREFIKTVSESGKTLLRPKLTSDAIPTIFNITNDGMSNMFAFNENPDRIHNFKHFTKDFKKFIDLNGWSTTCDDIYISLYKLKRSSKGSSIVAYEIIVDDDMHMKMFFEGNELHFDEITNPQHVLCTFSELQRTMEKCETLKIESTTTNQAQMINYLKDALNYVSKAKEVMQDDFEHANCVKILHDQLIQLTETRRRYDMNTILCSYSIYIQSSKTYDLIRKWGILILPNRTTLSRLGKFQDLDPSNKASNMNYLKKVASNLPEKEKFVVVQMDEIYSDPKVTFWKRLTGFAENTDEVATTVLGVLVSSCFGTMKQIVNLIPMKDGTGIDMHRYTMDAIVSLQDIGFTVLAIVTDNNRINQNLFTLLAPDGSYKFQNPQFTERVIRLIYDSIHIFKNFRNNWINLKDLDKSFFYPKFDDHSIIQMATFADIRELYHSEKFKIIKAAPKLNLRTIYPSTFDRQRVPLALNIVHPTTCAALRANECDETAEFLEIIKTWFTIMNNRPKKNDVENSDSWRDPITSPDCFQVVFLKKFVEWMKRWKDLAPLLHTGGLSIDTFKAAISCTEGMIDLLDDVFKTCNIQEFFPGYVQTNDLEKRFGVYRQSSGCHYSVTIKQILETEKKLRIKTLIKQFPDEIRATRYTKKEYKIVDYTAYLDLLDSDYIEKFEDYDHGSFMYICGYVCHNTVNRLDCSLCKDLIVKHIGGSSSNDYFDYLQRGELILPTDNCLLILIHMSAILNAIRNDKEMRRKFQFSDDPSSILVLLTVEGIERNASFVVDWNDTCSCSVLYRDLFLPLMRTIANILLNNYRKKINDANLVRKMNESKEKKRKREEKKESMKEQEYEKCSEPKNRKCMIYEKIK